MHNFKILDRIKQLYEENTNILQYLRSLKRSQNNSLEDIMISYDFQAGTYSNLFKDNPSYYKEYSQAIANIIRSLGDYQSLMEVGVGEATTLGPVYLALAKQIEYCYGFDISWSRIHYAKRFLCELNISGIDLFIGDLFNIPFQDNSIDVIYTSHSIEPNSGREKEALLELYRVTAKYLILLEPSYELANEDARSRMREHGYITNLYKTALDLGFNIVEHRLFDIIANPLNPTGLMIIEKKNPNKNTVLSQYACPVTKAALSKQRDCYFSKESLLAYPIIGEIPCLLSQHAIVATKFMD